MLRTAAGIAASLTGAAFTSAQTFSIEYSLTATEVHAGTTTPVANPNGMFEPGESVLLQMTIGYGPAVGTVVPTPQGPGPIAGFYGTGAGVLVFPPTPGRWTHFGLAPGWMGGAGYVFGGATYVRGIEPFQWPAPVGSGAPVISDNPIENIWRGVWTPDTYDAQSVAFWVDSDVGGPNFGGLLVEYDTHPTTGHPLYTVASVPLANASRPVIYVNIVPSPSASVMLAMGAMVLGRRRRSA